MAKSVYDGYNTIEEIYGAVLYGKLKSFPKYTFDDSDLSYRILMHFFNNILKWDRDQICENFNKKLIGEYKLGGMLNTLFNNSPFEMLNYIYPGEFMPWELGSTPNSYWTLETAALATRWLIETKIQWSRNDVCSHLTCQTFHDNGLGGMLADKTLGLNFSPFLAIDNAYPGEFMPWEFYRVGNCFWDDTDKIYGAVRWLIEKKLKWSIEDIYSNFSHTTFIDNGLYFNRYINSSYEILLGAYNGILYPWNFNQVPDGFWSDGYNISFYVYHTSRCAGVDMNYLLDNWKYDKKLCSVISGCYFNVSELKNFIKIAYADNYQPPY